MNNLTIRIKLIIIFILIKVIPLLLIAYISYDGVLKLDTYLKNSTNYLFNQSKEIILATATASIDDSVRNLDRKSQISLEKISFEIANNLANFLYQRDEDIIFLSKIDISQNLLESFYKSKNRDIITHNDYYYDDKTNLWMKIKTNKKEYKNLELDILIDNKKEFNYTNPSVFNKTKIPLYKELSFISLSGKEIYKVSQINKSLLDVSIKNNTYINSEIYFSKVKELKKDEIYVSKVIGEYVSTKIIGTFTKEKAKKANIDFEPKKHAYAGKENPNGKKFEGIIRFVTPVYKNEKKIGYLSLALDHEHVMQFTDTYNPTNNNSIQDISDASLGNYAFMWDYKGRNISHPRDYFIVGYDKNTGKVKQPWLSSILAKKLELSNLDMNIFLDNYPIFENQSLTKRPNLKQLINDGNVGLDCRYLNFAPQCHGWMELTKNGGYGSFMIQWSNVDKLTTAASIPYFTGQYNNTKRGFGFITIGANVVDFHSAANVSKENVNKILESQTKHIEGVVAENENEIIRFITQLMNELVAVTFIMLIIVIIVALLLSNYLSKKIENLLLGTKMFSDNNLDYRIKITTKDEIGKLEQSFNNMASKIQILLVDEKKLNESLEVKVKYEIKKQREQEEILIQQSKLASMGEMIGNIAHQWRQPLNGLSLVIQNLYFTYKMGELDSSYMEKSITKANLLTGTMSRTIDDFRSFFKPTKMKEEFNLYDSLNTTLQLIESTFQHHDIKLIKDKIDFKIVINAYRNEFLQAILNIFTNAKDALIDKNVIDKVVEIRIYEENSFAVIEIEDNAKGISDDILLKIYDPYFTTKEEGKGTGIGLYMTKMIIENNMNGNITVNNTKDGVCFKIILPL